jgi:hypothetical protein
MKEYLKFYIDGRWVDPVTPKTLDVIDPATEQAVGRISLGSAADVDKAVDAGPAAGETNGQRTRAERGGQLEREDAGRHSEAPRQFERHRGGKVAELTLRRIFDGQLRQCVRWKLIQALECGLQSFAHTVVNWKNHEG